MRNRAPPKWESCLFGFGSQGMLLQRLCYRPRNKGAGGVTVCIGGVTRYSPGAVICGGLSFNRRTRALAPGGFVIGGRSLGLP